jgi:glycosyltransferase involved in cell wall biosynthesis
LLRTSTPKAALVYAYEDGAAETFAEARKHGIKCFYELPIAYWETCQRLLNEEAERLPDWEPTLVGTRDAAGKLDRKTKEVQDADVIVCPSLFVRDSLPRGVVQTKKCLVAEFGSPASCVAARPENEPGSGPLRVLFAGSMTQRKGLADVFAAMQLLRGSNVELTVMGSSILPLKFYRDRLPAFKYEPPRPHSEVLRLMRNCDLLILPSIVEGRALVQQEALSCGLPLIVTRNAGGEDLIETGKTGFLVPIRSPDRIAERITWFEEHRSELREMRACARRKALEYSWQRYSSKILSVFPSEGE